MTKNLGFIPFSKIVSFLPLPNTWYFPHRVPRILIIKKKKKLKQQYVTNKSRPERVYNCTKKRGFSPCLLGVNGHLL